MKPEILKRIGQACFGEDWTGPLSYELGVAERVVQRWASGDADMPGAVDDELWALTTYRATMTSKLAGIYALRRDRLMALLLDRTTDSAKAGN